MRSKNVPMSTETAIIVGPQMLFRRGFQIIVNSGMTKTVMNVTKKIGRYGPTIRSCRAACSFGLLPYHRTMKLENQNQNHSSDRANISLPSPQNWSSPMYSL